MRNLKSYLHFQFHSILLLLVVMTFDGSPNSTSAAIIETAHHPVSVVTADIYVGRFRTTMRLTCFAEDLELLQGVEALEDGFFDPEELFDATRDHAKYLTEKVTIRNSGGEIIPAQVAEIIDFDIPAEGIKAGTMMSYQMAFVLEFDYDQPPEFFTIEQNMVADGALLPSELKIVLKQAGVPAPYMHMMKPQSPETFRFDWDTAPLDEDASEAEQEKWFEEWFAKEQEKTLGISSYSSVYSFLYINRHQVRHEILIPLATLTTMMEFERGEESFLDVPEQTSAAEKIKTFFSATIPVRIDGVTVQPHFDRIDFYGLDLTDFAMQAEKRRVSMANGRVGVILSYSTKGPPSKIELTWDVFNRAIKSVDSVIFAYDQIEKTQFSTFLASNTYQWNAPDLPPLPPITGVAATIDLASLQPPKIRVPIISAALVSLLLLLLLIQWLKGLWTKPLLGMNIILLLMVLASLPFQQKDFRHPFATVPRFEISEKNATAVFSQLHKNLFRAFDYHHESDIYEALANSVDGELLRKLYLQINETLRVAEQGGAVSRIDEVNLLSGEPMPVSAADFQISSSADRTSSVGANYEKSFASNEPVFQYRCRWNLIGTIEHWGHIHERTNQYEADFLVQLKNDAWKITGMKMRDEQQGVVKTSLRKF